MPNRAKDLSIDPASSITSAPASDAPETERERRGEGGAASSAHDTDDGTTRRAPTDLPDPLGGAAGKAALAGRPDQGLRGNVGTGAGGATEWGKGMKDHPSRRAGHPDPN
jgi:hypothetical protein